MYNVDTVIVLFEDKMEIPITTTLPLKTTQIIRQAWGFLLDKYSVLVLAILLHSVRNVIIAGVVLCFTVDSPLSPTLVVATFVLLSTLSYLEIPRICLKLLRGESVNLIKLPNWSVISTWLLATLCFIVTLAIGLVLFVVPGCILGVLLFSYGFAVVDGDGPLQSLKSSWRIIRGAFWQAFFVVLIFLAPMAIFPPVWAGLDVALDLALTLSLALIYLNRRTAMQGTQK